MANMSYCMFENTYSDLLDCFEALCDISELSELSESEAKYAQKLIKLCERVVDNCEGMTNE